jgi:hypothetical protein
VAIVPKPSSDPAYRWELGQGVNVVGGRASYAYAVEKRHDDGHLAEEQAKIHI